MSLSSRQMEVVELVLRGFSNQEIARQLFITEQTVKFHLTNIYRQEGVMSRAQLIVKYLKDGVTQSEINAVKAFLK